MLESSSLRRPVDYGGSRAEASLRLPTPGSQPFIATPETTETQNPAILNPNPQPLNPKPKTAGVKQACFCHVCKEIIATYALCGFANFGFYRCSGQGHLKGFIRERRFRKKAVSGRFGFRVCPRLLPGRQTFR